MADKWIENDAVIIVDWKNKKKRFFHPAGVEVYPNGCIGIPTGIPRTPLYVIPAGNWRQALVPGRWIHEWGKPVRFEIDRKTAEQTLCGFG